MDIDVAWKAVEESERESLFFELYNQLHAAIACTIDDVRQLFDVYLQVALLGARYRAASQKPSPTELHTQLTANIRQNLQHHLYLAHSLWFGDDDAESAPEEAS
jgi:hypothetical protein